MTARACHSRAGVRLARSAVSRLAVCCFGWLSRSGRGSVHSAASAEQSGRQPAQKGRAFVVLFLVVVPFFPFLFSGNKHPCWRQWGAGRLLDLGKMANFRAGEVHWARATTGRGRGRHAVLGPATCTANQQFTNPGASEIGREVRPGVDGREAEGWRRVFGCVCFLVLVPVLVLVLVLVSGAVAGFECGDRCPGMPRLPGVLRNVLPARLASGGRRALVMCVVVCAADGDLRRTVPAVI